MKRKHIFTALGRCPNCRLLYRVPTDPPQFYSSFYQDTYASGLTTDLPAPDTLEHLKETYFCGTEKDFSSRIALLRALGLESGQRIFDFGASWGYSVWQLVNAGYEAVGFELSRRRAAYARDMLDVDVVSRRDEVVGPFDAVLACHVVEHLPRPGELFDWARELLRPGGLLVILTPNGCAERMRRDPARYHRNWGHVHPIYLDKEFYDNCFGTHPRLLASAPYDLGRITAWDRESTMDFELSGWELLCGVVL